MATLISLSLRGSWRPLAMASEDVQLEFLKKVEFLRIGEILFFLPFSAEKKFFPLRLFDKYFYPVGLHLCPH